jgi:dolichol kinase
MNLKSEFIRKSIHILALIVPLSYHFLDRKIVLGIIGLGVFVAICVEVLRFHSHVFRELFNGLLGKLLRDHETTQLTGSTYLLIGCFLTVLFFIKWIALVSLLFLIVSDALAAIVGRKWGRHKIWKDRSVEGCAVFLVSAFLNVLIVPDSHFLIGMAGVVTACAVDIFIHDINDNLTIPLSAGIVMQGLVWLFG